jgi:hypothetical protein
MNISITVKNNKFYQYSDKHIRNLNKIMKKIIFPIKNENFLK